MKLSPQWVRDFVDLNVNYHQLAEDLTLAGIAVESVSGEGDETIFEMDITTNRPDAMNHYGVARECSAIYDLPLKPIEPELRCSGPARRGRPASISHRDSGRTRMCAVYCAHCSKCDYQALTRKDHAAADACSISGLLTMLWMRRITRCGRWASRRTCSIWICSKAERSWCVGRAMAKMLKTLDGVERKLTSEDLVVADAKKPVGLAGTMGGFDTMITEKTRNILIESAWWDPVTVRKMSRRHGLHTDASHRFERGADYESTVLSCDRVAELILQSGGGELGGLVDVIARKLDLAPIALHLSEVQRILGEKLETNEILRILRRLGFEMIPEHLEEPEFTVLVPSWRLDVEREIDVIEEIARLHGYDKFPNTLPAYVGAVVEQPDAPKDKKLRTSLLALGYDEAISLTFISHHDAEQFSSVPVIELANPLSEEASVMRTSMVPGMLNMLGYNLNRGSNNVRLFEAGNVFEWAGEKTAEFKRICMGATGNASLESVHSPPRPLSFFDVKGDVETLLAAFQHSSLEFKPDAAEYYHPGRSALALMDGDIVAQFGQIHPQVAAGRKLKQNVFVAELYLDRLYNRGLRAVRYEPLPRYPAVERDFSFIFDDVVEFARIEKEITGLGLSELRSFVPVEIFRGGSIPAGKYSLLLRATFQSKDRTLREDEVARWSAEIVKALESLGGTLRAS